MQLNRDMPVEFVSETVWLRNLQSGLLACDRTKVRIARSVLFLMVRDVEAAVAASPLDWYSSPQRFLQDLLHPVIPSAPWRSPYDCSLPSLIGFDNEEMDPSLQKDPLLRWPDRAESHR